MLTIGFDAKRAAQNATGLGNYSRFVMDGLAAYAPRDYRYVCYVPNAKKDKFLNAGASFRKVYPASPVQRALPALWRSFGITSLLEGDRVDLYHGLSNELPLNIGACKGVGKVVTIHDVIFRIMPQGYKPADRLVYDHKWRKACRDADRIVAVSECTKRDVVRFYGVGEDKVDVVYQGCDKQFLAPRDERLCADVRRTYGLPESYILYLGSIESRKNLMQLARALTICRCDLPVVAVGRRTPYADLVARHVAEHRLSGRFMMLHGVPFGHLPAFYDMACMFVYTSFYEGFGIPLLEALNRRVPVIAATGSCLEEAGGPHSLYVDPRDDEALADAVDRLAADTALRQSMAEHGLAHASRFAAERVVADLLDVYERALP